jgi:hypothetical protein
LTAIRSSNVDRKQLKTRRGSNAHKHHTVYDPGRTEGMLISWNSCQHLCVVDNTVARPAQPPTNEIDFQMQHPQSSRSAEVPAAHVASRTKHDLAQGQREGVRKLEPYQGQTKKVGDERDILQEDIAFTQKDIEQKGSGKHVGHQVKHDLALAQRDHRVQLEGMRKQSEAYQEQAKEAREERDILQENLACAQRDIQQGASAMHDASRAKHDLAQAQRDHGEQLESIRRQLEAYQEQAKTAREERDILRDDLTRAHKDIAALRDQVKLTDVVEPRQVVSKFDDIRVAVWDLCFAISDAIVGISHLTTGHIPDWRFLRDLPSAPLRFLWESGTGKNRPLDELLELRSVEISQLHFLSHATTFQLLFSMRVIINSHLNEMVFTRFHPHLNHEQSKIIEDIYAEIRQEGQPLVYRLSTELISTIEPQIISGTFRANMFKGVDRLHRSRREELSRQFILAVRHDWTSILPRLPEFNNNGGISDKHMETLKGIYFEAYEWNAMARSHCISLDFHARTSPPDAKFNDQTMDCQVNGDKRPRHIICAVAFGLWSSVAVGKKQNPEYICQEKARVLSELYFQNN